MTAPVTQADFAFALLAPGEREQVAAMWRGAILQQFAKIEACTLQCLVAVDKAGKLKQRLSKLHTAWPRFACLSDALADTAFATYSTPALKSLGAVQDRHELRTALAHGRLKVTDNGITFRWHVVEGAASIPKLLHLTWPKMLEELFALLSLGKALGSQLGQINRICESAYLS